MKSQTAALLAAFGTQKKLARELNLSENAISKWAARGFVPPSRAWEIIQLFNKLPIDNAGQVTLEGLIKEAYEKSARERIDMSYEDLENCDPTHQRRDQILEQMCDLLSDKITDDETVVCVEIYILKPGLPSIFFSYASLCGSFKSQLYPSSGIERTTENAFMALRRILKPSEEKETWNKARFLVLSDEDYSFEYKACNDVNWLSKISATEIPDVKKHIEIQKKILSWDGIPDSFRRWW